MSRFLKLSNIIINKKYIQTIDINKDKLVMHIMSNKTNGFFMFGGGWIDSYNNEVVLCKIKNYSDYKVVSDWIDNELK